MNKKESESQDTVTALSPARMALHRIYEGLENKETFTVQEAACLLLMSPIAVRQAVRRGDLKGTIVNHRVICISRGAIIDWLHTKI